MAIPGRNKIIMRTTQDYLDAVVAKGAPLPKPGDIECEIMERVRAALVGVNSMMSKSETKYPLPDHLELMQIAAVLAAIDPVIRIPCAGTEADESCDQIGFYTDSGPYEGVYRIDDDVLCAYVRKYEPAFEPKQIVALKSFLRPLVKRRTPNENRDLIALQNGIFNYQTKTLQPFSSDIVFLSKSQIGYNAAAVNPVIMMPDGLPWDVESWMSDLTDDPGITNLLWQLIGACLRPMVHWDRAFWFYSERGNNGKGTYNQIVRNILGPRACASVSIAEFAEQFALTGLIGAQADIVDENDVGAFIETAAALKAAITGDILTIDRKFQDPILFRFHGLMIQGVNGYPKFRDRSESFYRRQVVVPFSKCFSGRERKYIKADYLARQNVLEYVVKRVLEMDYYEFEIPSACDAALADYKQYNDPVRAYLDEMLPQFAWDLVPYKFLYDLYKAWFASTNPRGQVESRTAFIHDIDMILDTGIYPEWRPTNGLVKTQHMMDAPEMLISDYNLAAWFSRSYHGSDISRRCIPPLATSYRGIRRVQPAAAAVGPDVPEGLRS